MKTNIILLLLLSFQITSSKKVFEETKIKSVTFKNRLFKGAVFDFTMKNDKITEDGFKYYEEYAKNEIGTIITGSMMTDDNYKLSEGFFKLDSDSYIDEYKKFTSRMHKYNTRIIASIGCSGINKDGKLLGPSNGFSSHYNSEFIEISKEEILTFEDNIAKGALRAKKAGFDGIELGFGHWGLYGFFLAPAYNKRNDEYGGSDENRARIIVETIEKIRKLVGNDYLIIMKINSRDGFENGVTEQGFITASKMAEKAGVDIIEVSGSDYQKVKMKTPYYFESTKKLADIVNIPVMLIGGIRDLDTMEDILKNTKIEYFGIVRPVMCEPDLPKYWKEKGNRKSKCISCNGCFKEHACVFRKKNKNLKK